MLPLYPAFEMYKNSTDYGAFGGAAFRVLSLVPPGWATIAANLSSALSSCLAIMSLTSWPSGVSGGGRYAVTLAAHAPGLAQGSGPIQCEATQVTRAPTVPECRREPLASVRGGAVAAD
jgi:hypothetical protein